MDQAWGKKQWARRRRRHHAPAHPIGGDTAGAANDHNRACATHTVMEAAGRPCACRGRWRFLTLEAQHQSFWRDPMRTPPSPIAPLSIRLAPRERTLLCMPAGSTLRLAHGRVALHTGPLVLGQVIVEHQPTGVLDSQGEWTAPAHPPATWLRLSNCIDTPSAALLVEAPATPAISAMAWNALTAWWTLRRQAADARRWPFGAARPR